MKEVGKTLGMILIVCVCFMLGWFINSTEHPVVVQMSMTLVLASLPVAGIWMKRAGMEKTTYFLLLIIVAGMIMRIGYLLYTPYTYSKHDLGKLTVEHGGHMSYILNIVRHKLPDGNYYQFYQQPFFYILGGTVSSVIIRILHTLRAEDIVDAARIVSCAASCLILPASDALCRICHVGSRGRVLSLAFVAFSPIFYMTGGALGPDALCTLFMVLAVLYTLKWYQEPSVKNTVLLALIYGFGVMTKISVAVISFFTLAVFIYRFVRALREKKWLEFLKKYILFGVISLPIGLWYSIRNYVLFGQPLGYVLDLGGADSPLYTGEYSILQRICSFSLQNVFEGSYVNVKEDYNAPVYYIKSSLFGEYTYDVPDFIPAILLYAAIAVALLSVVAFIWQISQGKNTRMAYVIPAVIFLFYGSVTYFYLKYPYACSMDYRYMGLLSVLAAVLLGNFYENCSWKILRKTRIVEVVLGCYCLSSIILYVLAP